MKKQSLWMPLFVLILLLCTSCGSQKAKTDMSALGVEVMTLEQIWEIEDPYSLVLELDSYIAKKCQYGSNIAVLSDAEKVFYMTQKLEMDVNSGGFGRFLFYAEEECIVGVVQAFEEIGAVKTAAICEKALHVYGRELPLDMSERQDLILELESDEVYELLNECDSAFFEYEEDLTALNYEYVMKHKSKFS